MIGEALRLIRVYHDLKQKDVAKRVEVSTSYLSEIEKGHKAASLDLIRKYSETFDIPMSSILFFAEQAKDGGSFDRARSFVAGKMMGLLQFLEDRAERGHAD